MDSEERNNARIRQFLLEHSSEEDNSSIEDGWMDENEEDHISASDHDTNTTVDDSDADPNYEPSGSEFEDVENQMDIEELDDVGDIQVEAAVPTTSSDNVLSTVDTIIEAVVGGFGGQEDSTVSSRNRNEFFSKDKLVRWKKTIEARNVRTRSINLVRTLPGPIQNARQAKTPLECFQLFVDEEIINIITTNTNIFIGSISENYKRERSCRMTDNTEITAFLGLLILAGSFRSGHQNLEDLFRQDGLGIEIFYGTMSLDRFKFLLRTIRFDNINTRRERRPGDKFAAFREVFDIFVRNCERNFSLGCSTTIDEQLVPFRGKCPFKQYMKSKPAKYGIKIFTLTDAKMFYVKTMEVYLGTQPENSKFVVSNKPYDIVLRLIKSIEGKGRNVTADNWFTSYPLVHALLKKQTTYVGTMKKDKGELPPELTQKQREPYSSIFGFQDQVTIVSYAPKENRSVVLISSMHHDDDKIDPDSGIQSKPEIITYYNSTKSGVDVVDEKCGTYSTSRRCRRWPLVLFYRLLDIAGINSQVICTCNNVNINQKRRLFLKEIGLAMVKPQAGKRTTIACIPKTIRQSAQKISQVPVEEKTNNGNARGKKVRCIVCPRNKDIKTNSSCVKCEKPMCIKHMKTVCEECLIAQDDSE